MNVYCREESQVWGPVPEAALKELLAAGIVTPHTDVLLEGRMRWEPLGDVFPHLQPAAPFAPHRTAQDVAGIDDVFVTCSLCRHTRLKRDVRRIGGHPVCAWCRLLLTKPRSRDVPTSHSREENGVPERFRILQVARAQRRLMSCALAITITLLVMVAATLQEPASGFFSLLLMLWPNLAVVGGVSIYLLAEALRYPYPILWLGAGTILCACGIGLLLMLVLHHQATRRIRSAGFTAGFFGPNLIEIATKLQPRSILPSMSRWACHHEET